MIAGLSPSESYSDVYARHAAAEEKDWAARVAIAYHEAGHAVVAAALGRKVERITAGKDKGDAYVADAGYWTSVESAVDVGAILLAGQIAEHMFDAGIQNADRLSSDGDHELLRSIANYQPNPKAFIEHAARLAAIVIDSHKARVHRLADDLMKSGIADGRTHVSLVGLARMAQAKRWQTLNSPRITGLDSSPPTPPADDPTTAAPDPMGDALLIVSAHAVAAAAVMSAMSGVNPLCASLLINLAGDSRMDMPPDSDAAAAPAMSWASRVACSALVGEATDYLSRNGPIDPDTTSADRNPAEPGLLQEIYNPWELSDEAEPDNADAFLAALPAVHALALQLIADHTSNPDVPSTFSINTGADAGSDDDAMMGAAGIARDGLSARRLRQRGHVGALRIAGREW
ncbi:MAG TPA: hypothetical protein VFC78_02775 [Tepidisphaeraceae bacterium]|nr:hypothetical protein [Tepidisphaeraceae bacterium]